VAVDTACWKSNLIFISAMGTFISCLIHPFSTVRRLSGQYDEEGDLGDLIYHLTLFFAFGIYTVIRRHLNAQSRPKSFRVEIPEVWMWFLRSILCVMLNCSCVCSKRTRPGQMVNKSKMLTSSPTDTIRTLHHQRENCRVAIISRASILLQAYTWRHL
jgi:hypothetical protein